MKKKKKILSKFKRKVMVAGQEWTYRVTRKTFHICNPERTKKWTFGHSGWQPCECRCHDDGNWYLVKNTVPKHRVLFGKGINSKLEVTDKYYETLDVFRAATGHLGFSKLLGCTIMYLEEKEEDYNPPPPKN